MPRPPILRPEPVRPVRIETRDTDPLSALLARLLDTIFTIPGTNIRLGLDAIIDLFPGAGSAAGAVISTVLIAQAARLGVPRIVLARMAGNVVLNAMIGAVPFLGAVLSIFFRSNVRNYELLRRHAGQRSGGRVSDWIFVGALVVLLLGLLGAAVAAVVWVVQALGAR